MNDHVRDSKQHSVTGLNTGVERVLGCWCLGFFFPSWLLFISLRDISTAELLVQVLRKPYWTFCFKFFLFCMWSFWFGIHLFPPKSHHFVDIIQCTTVWGENVAMTFAENVFDLVDFLNSIPLIW